MEQIDKKERPLSKSQMFFLKAAMYIVGMVGGAVIFYAMKSVKLSERRRKREQLRYFKPTYRQTFWGTYTDWTERDSLLTDDELDNYSDKKIM